MSRVTWTSRVTLYALVAVAHVTLAWVPDTKIKLEINKYDDVQSEVFYGNASCDEYFTLLHLTSNYFLVGARNVIYNLTYGLEENRLNRLEWRSSETDIRMCLLKGKSDNDCHNYVRVFVQKPNGDLFLCGTNAFKPLCRNYRNVNDTFVTGRDFSGIGQCPYAVNHNSTAVYYNNQLFTATAADFLGDDSLIYREPLRTEPSDLKQLNSANFVKSFGLDNFVYFFFRETAVEYINCGKSIFSRVARVCKDDKGGQHHAAKGWTTYVKARLNCSVPGNYPFYFDEIQALSDPIRGHYLNDSEEQLVYGVLTTPVNAISGSAICAYSMRSINTVFKGAFKGQDNIDSNWLPVSNARVPLPRPGTCVADSRTLPPSVVNFVKSHPLMDVAVPNYFAKPLLIRVSLQYRLTTIAVDAQVKTLNGTHDVLYVGSDNGQLYKTFYHLPDDDASSEVTSVIVYKMQVMPPGTAISGLQIIPHKNAIVIIAKNQIRVLELYDCRQGVTCSKCLNMQDPHCAWDLHENKCVPLKFSESKKSLIQSLVDGNDNECKLRTSDEPVQANAINMFPTEYLEYRDHVSFTHTEGIFKKEAEPQVKSAETFHVLLCAALLCACTLGFVGGFIFAKGCAPFRAAASATCTEQRNIFQRLQHAPGALSMDVFRAPGTNAKNVNLATCNNIQSPKAYHKDSNLLKELNNHELKDVAKEFEMDVGPEDTLQKIKKTYI